MSGFIDFLLNHWALSSLFVVLLGGYIGIEFFYAPAGKSVSPQQLVDLMNHQNAVVLDVRSKEVFAAGHIIGAVNIPQEEIDVGIKKIQKYAKKTIIIACAGGRDVAKVMVTLRAQGFQHTLVLSGGMQAWISSGLPLNKN